MALFKRDDPKAVAAYRQANRALQEYSSKMPKGAEEDDEYARLNGAVNETRKQVSPERRAVDRVRDR